MVFYFFKLALQKQMRKRREREVRWPTSILKVILVSLALGLGLDVQVLSEIKWVPISQIDRLIIFTNNF